MKIKLNFFQPKQNFWLELCRLIFRVSFLTFTVLFIVGYLIPGFVTNWFNPIWLLIIAIISGIIVVTKE